MVKTSKVSVAAVLLLWNSMLLAACETREKLDKQIQSLTRSAEDLGSEVESRITNLSDLKSRRADAPVSREELRCAVCLSDDSTQLVDPFVASLPVTKEEITEAIAREEQELQRARSRLKALCERLGDRLNTRAVAFDVPAKLPWACRP